jgi:hypothetical protein
MRGVRLVRRCAYCTDVVDGVKKGDCAACIGDLPNGCALVDKIV